MIYTPSASQLATIPTLYSTEHVPIEDKVIHAHFFLRDSHWFITEFDQVDLMFGFCILNGDMEMAEWGYVGLEELKSINILGMFQVEYDVHWMPRSAKEVELIQKGRRYA
ncbi:MAG: DUF2958 domain-containing protein [Desulfobacter sp.]|nr:MAG: DUF2958 domain-containing protein [Desulfobacter sp.]